MKAKFIGTKESYEGAPIPNETYIITIKSSEKHIWLYYRKPFSKEYYCPYDTIRSLNNDWEVVL